MNVAAMEKRIKQVRDELREAKFILGSEQTQDSFERCVDLIREREDIKAKVKVQIALQNLKKDNKA